MLMAVTLNQKVALREINGIVYTYDFTTGKTLVFNNSGSYIISELTKAIEFDIIVNDFSRHFGCSHAGAATIINDFLKVLERNHIIEREEHKTIEPKLQKEEVEPNQTFLKFSIDNLIPLYCHFELTYKCNFNCLHCYNPKRGGGQELSFIEINRILRELQRAGTLFLTFSGGEVFARNDWYSILSMARELGFVINLLTNGSLIEENMIENLKSLELNNLQVSFLSHNKKRFRTITGSDSFEKVKKNIILLKNNGIAVSIGMTAMELNFEDIDEIMSFGKSHNIPVRLAYFVVPKNGGDMSPLTYRLHSNKLQEVVEKTNTIDSLNKTKNLLADYNYVCTAGLNQFLIIPNGEIYPCIQISQSCGSLRNSSFQNIWNNSEVFAFIRSIKVDDLKVCKDCELYNYCDRCGGMALLEKGNYLDISPYNCEIAKIMKGGKNNELGKKNGF